MTELENTDSLSTENVTVTSDSAFERVTSDIKMEEWEDWWYLKQNTAWLVQEIPNISILDISDFLIENKKTLYDRQNWNIVVGKAGRSIEAQPQDVAVLTYTWEFFEPTSDDEIVPFDDIDTSSNLTIFSISWNKAEILEDWIYRISYWWVYMWGTTDTVEISIIHERNWNRIYNYLYDLFLSSTGLNSWGKTGRIECKAGDRLYMNVQSDDYTSIRLQWLYLEIQFLQYKM